MRYPRSKTWNTVYPHHQADIQIPKSTSPGVVLYNWPPCENDPGTLYNIVNYPGAIFAQGIFYITTPALHFLLFTSHFTSLYNIGTLSQSKEYTKLQAAMDYSTVVSTLPVSTALSKKEGLQ